MTERLRSLAPPVDPSPAFDPDMVTPGVLGFFATVLVALAVMLLLWDFNRRVRRINDRAEIKERIAAELAAQKAGPQAEEPEPGSQ